MLLEDWRRTQSDDDHYVHFKLTNLLIIDGAPGQIREVHKLHVQRSELSQDATTSRGPAPVTANATGTEGMNKTRLTGKQDET